MSTSTKKTSNGEEKTPGPPPDYAISAHIVGYNQPNGDTKWAVEVYGSTSMIEASEILRGAADVLLAADETNASQADNPN